jgi:hypothetical protein
MGKSIRNLSTVRRVGLDRAKRVFQVHAVDAKGEIVVVRGSGASQRWATATCASFWWWAPARRCAIAEAIATPSVYG